MTCANPQCQNPLGRETEGYLNARKVRIPLCALCRKPKTPRPKRETKTADCPFCGAPMCPQSMKCRACAIGIRKEEAAERRRECRTCPTCQGDKGEWSMQCRACANKQRDRLRGTP